MPAFRPVATAGTPAPARTAAAEGSVLLTLLGAYIFMHVILWAEIVNTAIGFNLRMTAITGLIVTAGVLFSGHLLRFGQLSIAKVWLALLALYLLASLAGFYPRGSLTTMWSYATRFHTFPLLICAVAHRASHVRRLMYWGGGSVLVALLLTFLYGQIVDGRLEIPDTTLGNPNDLALTLLLGWLFLMSMAYSESGFVRVVPFAALPITLYYVLQTGSRANFLTALLVGICLFFTAAGKVKLRLIALTPILVGAMLFLVPTNTLTRLTAVFTDPIAAYNPSMEHGDAIASQVARTRLQERAIMLTLQHPLLGVGPDEFAVAIERMVREESGRKSTWQNTHNVYLQVAAENGIPAVLCFIACMVWLIRTNFRVYRTVLRHPSMTNFEGQSLCLFLLSVAYSFGIAFGNYMYDAAFPILVGLTAANLMAFERELTQLRQRFTVAPVLPKA